MTPVPALADDYFRLAHHDTTGKLLLHPRTADLGLAAALLGELVTEQKIVIREGRLRARHRTPPADALAHAVLDQIVAQPQHVEARTWLGFLSTSAYVDVAGRLWRSGHVRPVTERRVLRRGAVTYVPTDLLTAAGPAIHLASILRRGEAVAWHEGFLLCLAVATGLDALLLRDLAPEAVEHCRRLCAAAPAPVGELAAITAAAVGDALLSYRT